MAFVKLSALQAGHFTMPDSSFITPCDPASKRLVPSLSFLIEHVSSEQRTTRILFDLGLRRVYEQYPEQIRQHMLKRQPYDLRRNILTSLESAGLTPDDIDHVILSHVHWDHVGMPADFRRSTFVVGPGSGDVLAGRTHQVGSHAVFERDLLPEERTLELKPPGSAESQAVIPQHGFCAEHQWRPHHDAALAPQLEHTLDLFGDGSVAIVNAPGHLQGHINLIVKRSDDPAYVYLAGDACHDRRLLHGEKQIAEWEVDGQTHCIHVDKRVVKTTIKKIVALEKLGVEVIFAHDKEWEEKELVRARGRLLG